jgi:hypothetical protein
VNALSAAVPLSAKVSVLKKGRRMGESYAKRQQQKGEKSWHSSSVYRRYTVEILNAFFSAKLFLRMNLNKIKKKMEILWLSYGRYRRLCK